MKKPTTPKPILLLLLSCVPALASEIHLAWDASPTPSVASYALYAHTNVLSNTNTVWSVRADVGTNRTATITGIASGQWYFAAAARDTNGVEGQLSIVLPYEIPLPPANLRTVVLQYSGSLSNFQDLLFFKLRVP